MKDKIKRALKYVTGGATASLASYLYSVDLTHGLGAVLTGYGFPLQWLEKTVIVYPGNPTRFSFRPLELLVDIAFWTVVIGGVAYLYGSNRRKKASGTPNKSSIKK